jgi:carboxylesterase
MKEKHAPLFFESKPENCLVVFIHGYMGSPRQFDYLAEAVRQDGCSTAALLLPGHGGSAKYFSSGSFERWQGHVDAEVERLSVDHDRILLVGHSMGGLLAINAAVKLSGHVRGIFTIACPFKVTNFSIYALRVRLRQVFGRKDDPIKSTYFSNCSVTLSPSLILHSAKPTAEFKMLMLAARETLPRVRVPVTAVYSSSDELTSIESLGVLFSELTEAPFEQVLLSDSLHVYYPEHEQLMIRQALAKLIMRTQL